MDKAIVPSVFDFYFHLKQTYENVVKYVILCKIVLVR